jgi:glycerol-3-phosphate dehydrogenase (NAD(P)+)
MVAARSHADVRLWAREAEVAESINKIRKNPFYLPEFELPRAVRPTLQLEEALEGVNFAIIAVPSHALRDVLQRMVHLLKPQTVIISATKGVENGTLMRMSQLIASVVAPRFEPRIVVLSGPSFAQEVARGDPTAVVAASASTELSEIVQSELSSSQFRIYTNNDVVGVELGGAVKNVVAIAAGVVKGLGFGTNSVAAIITRGLAEMMRLALAQGARAETLAGLTGLGDLVLTCTGDLSRNRRVGIELGRGRKLSHILAETREIAEGVKTTSAIHEMGKRLGVEMPITAGAYALLYEDKPALEAAAELMDRPLKRE